MRDARARIADVRNLLAAAARVAGDRSDIEHDLIRVTGLSREGVDLAFSRHMEREAKDEDLEKLVAYAGDAEQVLVILSANVFIAALRAIAVARAASTRVFVRTSKREPYFPTALIARAGDPCIRIASETAIADMSAGEIHVYGKDETIVSVRGKARAGVIVRGHGSGLGVAWISARADLGEAAALLASDVIAFDQRGCLSPRIAIAEGHELRANAFAHAMHRALEQAQRRVPRGVLDPSERASATMYVSTLQFAGRAFGAPDHVVGVGLPGAPLLLPPAGRHLHVTSAKDVGTARALLAPLLPVVVAAASDDLEAIAQIAPPHARLSALGEMQRPPLDGPVDRR